jgi:hypothetical protein
MNYKILLANNGASSTLLSIFDGEIEVPHFTLEAPVNPSFGFPPILVPLWSNGSWPGYIGVVKDWFGDRPDIYVEFFSELGSFTEIAKTFEQLQAWMVFDFLCNVPASDEVERFAESIGFCDADDIDDVFVDCDDVSDLALLDLFKGNLPAAVDDSEGEGVPEWHISPLNKADIRSLISNGSFEKAWYALNCSKLEISETKLILDELLHVIGDKKEQFSQLINCWCNIHNVPC